MTAELIHGDCIEQMAAMKAAGRTVDAIVTDPPYHLTSITKRLGNPDASPIKSDGASGVFKRIAPGFMGKQWDGGDIAFRADTWRLAYDLLKPGGHIAVFGGSRTHHRVMVALEDAGFEIRDTLFWIYGSGFPKSLDVSRAIDKMAGAEREVIGRYVPPNGKAWNLQNDVTRSDIGAVGHSSRAASLDRTAPATPEAQQWSGWGSALKPAYEPIILARKPLDGTIAGNVLKHGVGALNIDACRVAGGPRPHIQNAGGARENTEVFGNGKNGSRCLGVTTEGRWPSNILHSGDGEVLAAFAAFGVSKSRAHDRGLQGRHDPSSPETKRLKVDSGYVRGHSDEGTPARFFPALGYSDDDLRFMYCSKAGKADRAGSRHPCVKPVKLLRWIARLICPPGGTILDPFCGSGTTLRAALDEGFHAIGIEQELEYINDCRARLGLELEAAD